MRIILASTSPRRIELMKQLGFRIEVRRPNADETPRRGESPRGLVRRLSREKARSVFEDMTGAICVIAADTIVVAPDGRTILGKPRNKADAARMLASLAGRSHTVYTGYSIFQSSEKRDIRKISAVVRSRVTMRQLDREEIRRYIASGEPMDKAGSYAAQGRGMALIEKISGSYTNVVGLPMAQLVADLERLGFLLFDWSYKP